MSISGIVDAIRTALLAIGVPGIFLIAVLDSSLLTIPEINDILVVSQVISRPERVIYLPLVTAAGSVGGCLLLYALARKGGEAFLRKRFSPQRVEQVERFYSRYGSLALLIPALCPPPTPFKIFVATAGALRYPKSKFIVTILIARSLRYYIEGTLAAFYGETILEIIQRHALTVTLAVLAAAALIYLVYWSMMRRMDRRVTTLPAAEKTGEVATP